MGFNRYTIKTEIETEGDSFEYKTAKIKTAIAKNNLIPHLKSREINFYLLGMLLRSFYTHISVPPKIN